MRRTLGILAVCLLALAGCGGTHPHAAKVVAATGHPCAPSDFYMQCALPSAPVGLAPRSGPSVYGVDFGWSGISAARARALGAKFGASYFSFDTSKNWTAATVNAYHAAGLATVGVWETTATRAEGGVLAGISDAHSAQAQAAAVGNTTRPILFAIDCDCAASQILGYFQGVHSVLGNRADAYGGYSQVWAVYHAGLVGHENWQTYAWSRGGWLSAKIAPLEQYLNGSSFDNDRALAPAYGQWPYSAPKPRPLPVCISHREARGECAVAKARILSDQRAAASSQRAFTNRGCPVLDQRVRWFRAALAARPLVRTASRRRALAASRSAYRVRLCATFAQRSRFFTSAAAALAGAN